MPGPLSNHPQRCPIPEIRLVKIVCLQVGPDEKPGIRSYRDRTSIELNSILFDHFAVAIEYYTISNL